MKIRISKDIQHFEGETILRGLFVSRYFQMHFREWKVMDFDKDFIEACS